MFPSSLASSLIHQIQPRLPSDVTLTFMAESEEMKIENNEGRCFLFGLGAVLKGGPPGPKRAEIATFAFLNHLQDFLVVHTQEPWPSRSKVLPKLHVSVVENVIVAYYGDSFETGAMRVAIPLSDVA